MLDADLIAGVVIVFAAAIVRGFAGLGFSALTVASLGFIYPPAFVVPLVMLLEIAASIMMFASVRKEADWHWLRPVTVGLLIGTPIGVGLLALLAEEAVRPIIYGGLLAASGIALAGGVRRQTPAWLVGILAGVCNGIAAVAGLVAGIFLLFSGVSGARVRASLVVLFFISDLYAILWGGGFGLLEEKHLFFLLLFLPPLFIGIAIGARIFRRFGDRHYRRFVLALIFTIAAAGMLRWALLSLS